MARCAVRPYGTALRKAEAGTDRLGVSIRNNAMQPQLIITSGPLKGRTFPIRDITISIGRDSTNFLPLDDASVSRTHCCIARQDDGFRLQDMDSLNGTYVNDVKVTAAPLAHGDRIRIGSSQLVFLVSDSDGSPESIGLKGDDFDLSHYETVRLRSEDLFYLNGEEARGPFTSARLLRDVSALFRISHSINVIKGSEHLEAHLLESLFEVTPAERGAILLTGHNPQTVVSTTYLHRNGATGWNVSRTVTRQVLRDGVAMLSNDVAEDRQFSDAKSLILSRVRSLLCIPLQVYEQTLGVIYLDTTDPVCRFDEGHLQLVTAIAAIAAVTLDHARYVAWLEGENERLHEQVNMEHEMVGDAAAMRAIHQIIAKVAPRESTVLITGESGTGKELVARAIHKNSSRAGKPFVAINCAAINENLLESELFGHVKGAFTDAHSDKKGRLEIARGGTVFLDEIGELAPRLQAKLLRVLQEREISPVGGNECVRVDIRVIAATNRNLEEAFRSGAFRQDLFFRLNVIPIMMPPLRERRDDIPLLAAHFVKKYSAKCNRIVLGISRDALSILQSYEWPGNVRELENAIERAVVLGQSDRIVPEDLPEFLIERKLPANISTTRYHDAIQQLKRHLIIEAVSQSKGVYVEAAKLLGLHPNYLHRLIREMALKEELSNL